MTKKPIVLALIVLSLIALVGEASAVTFYSWRYREHATDCTALTDGKIRDLCYEIDADTVYKCEPTAGDCSGAEWKKIDTDTTLNLGGVETITGNWVNTANPWADDEVVDTITASNYLPLAGGTLTGDLIMSDEIFIRTGTSDVADNESTGIAGGGALSSIRGSFVRVSGNEDGNTGTLFLTAGNVTGGEIRLSTGGSVQVTIDDAGLVGFGLSSPLKDVHISSTVPTIRLSDSDAGTDQAVATLVELYRGDGTNRVGFWGMASASNNKMVLGTDYAAGEVSIVTGSNVEALNISSAGKTTLTTSGIALVVQNTMDASSNQVAIFKSGNRATPTDQDEGYFSFFNDDSTGTQDEFARITWIASDVTSTSKDSILKFAVRKTNILQTLFTIYSSATVFNEGQLNQDFRIKSNNNANMFVLDSGVDEIMIGTGTPLGAALGIIPHATTDVGLYVREILNQTAHIARFYTSGAKGLTIESGISISNGDIIMGSTDEFGDLDINPGAILRLGTDLSDSVEVGRVNLNTNIIGDLTIDQEISAKGYTKAIVTKTSNYTATENDDVILGNTNAFTVALPTAVGIQGKVYTIKKINTEFDEDLTVDPFSTQTIDGATTYILSVVDSGVSIMSDNANWEVIGVF